MKIKNQVSLKVNWLFLNIINHLIYHLLYIWKSYFPKHCKLPSCCMTVLCLIVSSLLDITSDGGMRRLAFASMRHHSVLVGTTHFYTVFDNWVYAILKFICTSLIKSVRRTGGRILCSRLNGVSTRLRELDFVDKVSDVLNLFHCFTNFDSSSIYNFESWFLSFSISTATMASSAVFLWLSKRGKVRGFEPKSDSEI